MGYHFCLADALAVSEQENDRQPETAMIRVHSSPSEMSVNPDTILVSKENLKILDIGSTQAISTMTHLIDNIQLYRLTLELIIDEALMEAQENTELKDILVRAFGSQGLPVANPAGQKPVDATSGDLNHPLIGHLSSRDLTEIYLKLLITSGKTFHRENRYGFNALVALNRRAFYEEHDGYTLHGQTFIRADKLLDTALRIDHDPSVPIEEYVERGREEAEETFETAETCLKAYLDADRFQGRRCEVIDQILTQQKKPPPWIDADIFSIMKREAKKQHYAEGFFKFDDAKALIETAPNIKTALENSATGNTSENLQQLLQETLQPGKGYSGVAKKFVERVKQRSLEAETIPGLHYEPYSKIAN